MLSYIVQYFVFAVNVGVVTYNDWVIEQNQKFWKYEPFSWE